MSAAADGTGGAVDAANHGAAPVHLRASSIGLVGVGGAVGTAARYLLSAALPPVGGFPLTILLINVAGSFYLGLLLERLARAGDDTGTRRRLRLLLGTGVLGGFTTYSTFAVDAVHLVEAGRPVLAFVDVVLSLVLGLAAAYAGIVVARRLQGRSGGRSGG